ncbi:MAG: 7-cyano-7-deazaguanine synthase QueC [Luminiphilus sp.]|nr:7-cyano-7-deazaguanine synthase QueC [Luminiphilus sp.]
MSKAIVLTSGGLDSATVLAIAHADGKSCFSLSVDYGQRHRSELVAAERVSRQYGDVLHRMVALDLSLFSGSALTDSSVAVPTAPTEGVPVTYVPARNTIFLSLALGWAEVVGAQEIYIGANAVDYSGYPDCRPEFITAFDALSGLATKAGIEGDPIRVQAPIINMTKAEIICLGTELGVDYGLTVSCYQADTDGAACGKCDSCRLRHEGFVMAGLDDPTHYVSA